MATTVNLNGTSYSIPAVGESTWGDQVSNYLIALGSGVLQKAGGTFTLTADVNFGTGFGLKAPYYTSSTTAAASAGTLRLASTDAIKWRNNANGADVALGKNASDQLTYAGTAILSSAGILLATAFPAMTGDVTSVAGAVATTVAAIQGTAVAGVTGTGNVMFSASPTTTGTLTGAAGSFSGTISAAAFTASVVQSTTYLIGSGTPRAAAGALRMANALSVSWRNAGDTADVGVSVNSSNQLTYTNGATVTPFLSSVGVLLAAAHPALTGDVTASVGTVATTVAAIAGVTVSGTTGTGNVVFSAGPTFTGTATFSGSPVASHWDSASANIASSGVLRLASVDTIQWRNNANGANVSLAKNTSDQLTYAGTAILSSAGILLATAFPALTGDVTTSSGAVATTIASHAVTGAKFRQSVALSVVGVTGSSTADVADIVGIADQVLRVNSAGNALAFGQLNLAASAAVTGALAIANGGTGQASKAASFDALHPMTTTGDMIYSSSGATSARLPVGSSGQVLKSVGGIPTWATFSGGINYISSNPDAEADTAGWATYADAAQNIPVDATGGAPNTTWTRSTSTPLRGAASFLLTKSTGASRQGEGVSYAFTLDTADQAKPLSISFDYIISSGTFTASDGSTPLNDGTSTTTTGNSDIEVFIYDVTNSQLIVPTGQVLTSSSTTIPGTYKGTFQTSATGTSYRLVLHTAKATNAALTARFDNFYVGPQVVTNGPAMTDWVLYTPTIVGMGTVVSPFAMWRRNGDSIEIKSRFTTGTCTAVTATFSLPNNLTTDLTKLTSQTIVGSGSTQDATAKPFVIQSGGSVTTLQFGNEDVNSLSSVNGTFFTNAIAVAFYAKVPIQGWSSNVSMSSDTDTRIVAAEMYQASAQSAFTASTIIAWDTVNYDTHGAFTSGASSRYTAPVSGTYKWTYTITSGSVSWTAGQNFICTLYKNGSQYTGTPQNTALAQATGTYRLTNSGVFTAKLSAGDYIEIRCSSSVSQQPFAGGGVFGFIERTSGPAVVAATETVAAKYITSAGQSIANGATPQVNFDTKVYDTHNAVTTGASWKFTAPTSGKYRVTSQILYNSATFNAANTTSIYVNVNGSTSAVAVTPITATASQYVQQTMVETVGVVAGDTIDVRTSHSESSARSLYNNNSYCRISIERIGN